MDACSNNERLILHEIETIASELDAWFSVSGDMDDFIYFGDCAKPHSER